MWNEPNLTGYWSRQPFAKRYVALTQAARRALKAADPGSRAILAGLPNGWAALRKIYEAGGRSSFDAAAIHPYTARPERVPRFLREARRVMRRFGDRRKPLWVTEMSWPAAKGRARDPIGIATTDRGQARRLARRAEGAGEGPPEAAGGARLLVHVAVGGVGPERVRVVRPAAACAPTAASSAHRR